MRLIRFVCGLLIVTILAGCASSSSAAYELQTSWVIGLDTSAVVIHVDEDKTLVQLNRTFGAELLAVSTDDGSPLWNEVVAPSPQIEVIGDVAVVLQLMQGNVLLTGIDMDSGESLWSKSFTDDPLATRPDGTFLIQKDDGDVRAADMGGVSLKHAWSPDDGCGVLDAVAVPTTNDSLLVLDCDGRSKIVTLDEDLHERNAIWLDKAGAASEDRWFAHSASVHGEFVVVEGSQSTAFFVDGSLVAQERMPAGTEVHPDGGKLRLESRDGALRILDESGKFSVPEDGSFSIALTSVGLGVTQFELIDYGSSARRTLIEDAIVEGWWPLSSGAGQMQLVKTGNERALRRLDAAQSGGDNRVKPITVRSGSFETTTTTLHFRPIEASRGDAQARRAELRFFGDALTDPTGSIEVLQLNTAEEARRVADRANDESDSWSPAVAQSGRCVASATFSQGQDRQLLALIAGQALDEAVEGGCLD